MALTSAHPDALEKTRIAVGGALAAVLGAAPHVLHHVGPLAGAALLAGATGQLLFGLLAFALAIPMLRRIRRRSGSWRRPVAVLCLMAIAFTISTLVVGPALREDGGDDVRDGTPAPRIDHEAHHGG